MRTFSVLVRKSRHRKGNQGKAVYLVKRDTGIRLVVKTGCCEKSGQAKKMEAGEGLVRKIHGQGDWKIIDSADCITGFMEGNHREGSNGRKGRAFKLASRYLNCI